MGELQGARILQTLLTQCAGGSEPTAGSNFFQSFQRRSEAEMSFSLKDALSPFLNRKVGKAVNVWPQKNIWL